MKFNPNEVTNAKIMTKNKAEKTNRITILLLLPHETYLVDGMTNKL